MLILKYWRIHLKKSWARIPTFPSKPWLNLVVPELNENKYGIHVNITNCPLDTIQEIKEFIVNNEKQEEMLNNMEHIKQDVKDKYFS